MSHAFLPYARQSINAADIEAVKEALQGELITRGAKVEAFERAIAEDCGASYAVAFNSATTALAASYFAVQASRHDRVISTPNSFIASIGSVIQSGGYPYFIDIDRSTGNLNIDYLWEALDFHSTRGRLIIVPVHFAGIAMDVQAIYNLLYPYPDAIIIEDAAHAIGSFYPDGKKVGSCAWSDLTVFSFHPAKTITTGEGGMVTTNRPDLYQRLLLYRNNGIVREPANLRHPENAAMGYYEVQAITGNFHMTEMQAALGLSQFQRLEEFITKRRRLLSIYRQKLHSLPFVHLFTDQVDARTAWHLCVVQINFAQYQTTRKKCMELLKERGIGTQVHYIPLYRHPICAKENQPYFPEMEQYAEQALSLPLHPDMQDKDVERVCRELQAVLKKK